MALTIDNLSGPGTMKIILKIDPALEGTSQEEYSDYLRDLNESKLKVKDGEIPTRWVMKKQVKYGDKQRIDDMKIKIGDGGRVGFGMAWMAEEIRCTLVDVENPDSVPVDKRITLKKSGDGTVMEDTMSMLGEIPTLLYYARASHLMGGAKGGGADLKKE